MCVSDSKPSISQSCIENHFFTDTKVDWHQNFMNAYVHAQSVVYPAHADMMT